MRKILLFLLLTGAVFGQSRKITFDNFDIIDSFIAKIDVIAEVNGSHWIAIPLKQDILEGHELMFIDNYPIQYKVKPNGDIQIKGPKTEVYVFDFKLKAHGMGVEANDGLCRGRPKDPAKKVKAKLKENKLKEKKEKASVNNR